ncbi:elicitor-responsive protein 1-like [Helianthus annuus]|nr:elicitor-responsive protein 1-like [Helianthus annuus]XP_035841041.1 elicitor-responsive protein 1-like [Helianthus annuus]
MATPSIHGNLLQVTVASCNNLKDTEWISRQDPYVCVEYGSDRSRTRTCTDGGKNPNFQEKFAYTLIEGLRELNISVWNSNTVHHDTFIGSGKVQLAKAISQGFDDSTWPLQSKTGRDAGEVRLIIQYTKPIKPANSQTLPQGGSLYPLVSYPPSPMSGAPYPPVGVYPAAPSSYPSYPPNLAAYQPSPYPPQGAYYAQPYPPNSAYHPPQPYGSQYPPCHPYPGTYPPLY